MTARPHRIKMGNTKTKPVQQPQPPPIEQLRDTEDHETQQRQAAERARILANGGITPAENKAATLNP